MEINQCWFFRDVLVFTERVNISEFIAMVTWCCTMMTVLSWCAGGLRNTSQHCPIFSAVNSVKDNQKIYQIQYSKPKRTKTTKAYIEVSRVTKRSPNSEDARTSQFFSVSPRQRHAAHSRRDLCNFGNRSSQICTVSEFISTRTVTGAGA
jgi:hypothetical protein